MEDRINLPKISKKKKGHYHITTEQRRLLWTTERLNSQKTNKQISYKNLNIRK